MNFFRSREPASQSGLSLCKKFAFQKNFSTSSWVVIKSHSKSSNQGPTARHFPLPAQTNRSTRAPNPKAFRGRIRWWEGPIPLLSGTLKLPVITVSISLVCGTDHPGYTMACRDKAPENVILTSFHLFNEQGQDLEKNSPATAICSVSLYLQNSGISVTAVTGLFSESRNYFQFRFLQNREKEL